MKVLWNNSKPLIASDIIKQNTSLNINTVQTCLRTLVADKAVKIADIVYSGTVLTRSYTPLISREEYFNNTYKDIVGKDSFFPLFTALIDAATNLNELEDLEKIIAQRKQEIEKDGKK